MPTLCHNPGENSVTTGTEGKVIMQIFVTTMEQLKENFSTKIKHKLKK
jgi:hypothetical protein